MPLKIEYPDKYRLWTEMVRGGVDRLFVATTERLPIGAPTELRLHLPDLTLPIVVEGFVVGRRPKSRRFDAGVYLRFEDREVDKCRRFLGLAESSGLSVRARRTARTPHQVSVTFADPASDVAATCMDLSVGGMQVRTTMRLMEGQRVRLWINVDDGDPLRAYAEVRWVESERSLIGLRFIELASGDAERLGDLVRQQFEIHRSEEKPQTVVVADDDPDILRFVGTALGKNGYDVHQTVKGYEALELIRKHKPRMAILDILMPGIDGADICRILRADDELAELPVIFISAMQESELGRVAEEAGATDFLSKPMKLRDLLDLVEAYLA